MMQLKEFLEKLPWWLKNIYSLVIFIFLIWMVFFDRNNVISNYKTSKKLNTLLNQKAYYIDEIEKVNLLKTELFSTKERKEKFAREKYFMKKENEDIFIIKEKEIK